MIRGGDGTDGSLGSPGNNSFSTPDDRGPREVGRLSQRTDVASIVGKEGQPVGLVDSRSIFDSLGRTSDEVTVT